MRSSRPETRNPLLALQSAARLADLPEDSRAALRALLVDIRTDAAERAQTCWRKHKAPMAAYWKAVSVYAGHAARALGRAMPKRDADDLARLERALAYSAARSDVECCCHQEGEWTDGWYDPSSATLEEDREAVATAIRYLDLRGLLERSPEGWVRVREDAQCA